MSTPSHEPNPTSSMDAQKPRTEACGAGCGCHANATSGRTRRMLGVVILAAAAVLAVRAVLKTTAAASATTARAAAAVATFAAPPSAAVAAPAVARELGAFADLDTLAADTTAVFVFVPGKGLESSPPTVPMAAAARTLAAQGKKIGLFTLKTGSPDYEQMAGQVTVPGVLVLAKGCGMQVVSGEITETELVQAFVTALGAGGCGSGGCGATAGHK